MQIHDQLLADCHVLGALDHARALLNRHAAVGWLIVVPATDAADWHQLDDIEHARISAQVRALSGFVARWFKADKLNVATLGNRVSQMHIHIVARRFDDPCWPQPVWGNLNSDETYTPQQVETLRDALARELALVPERDSDA